MLPVHAAADVMRSMITLPEFAVVFVPIVNPQFAPAMLPTFEPPDALYAPIAESAV